MESAKNERWIIPFKKFGMVRVNKEADVKFQDLPQNSWTSTLTETHYYHDKRPRDYRL